jgi:hypothetical protein
LLVSVGLKHGELDLLAGGPPCQGFSKNIPLRAFRVGERFFSGIRSSLNIWYTADMLQPRAAAYSRKYKSGFASTACLSASRFISRGRHGEVLWASPPLALLPPVASKSALLF